MRKNAKSIIAKTLAFTLALSLAAVSAPDSEAAKKPKLSTNKVTVTVGKSKKVKIKNVTKNKVKSLKVKSSKTKIATAKKKGKTALTVTGKRKGTAKVTAKVTLKGTKKATTLTLKVTVKDVTPPTDTPATTAPATSAPATSAPATTTPPATGGDQTTPPAGGGSQTTPPTSPDVTENPGGDVNEEKYVCNYDFEDDSVGDFFGRSNDGSVELSVIEGGHDSEKAMLVSGRVKDWTGPAIDISDKISECATYRIHFFIRNHTAQKTKKNFYLSQGLSVEEDDAESYLNDASFSLAKSETEWTEVTYDLTSPAKWDVFFLYIETVYGTAPNLEFVIDDFSIELLSKPGDIDESLASIKDTYADYFDYMGMAVSYDQLMNENGKGIKGFLQKHFNSVTMGNEMKPDAILKEATTDVPLRSTEEEKADDDSIYVIPEGYTESTLPVIDFKVVDKCLKKASDDGYKLRFHTLIWHEQMPSFFFKEGYIASNSYVDETTMYAREEMFVRTVMNHILSSEYADVIYAVDVVNEYLNSYDGTEPKSTNYWAPIFGEVSADKEYVKKAFVWAYDELDRFGKTDSISLFYNDFNTYYNVEKVVALINSINTVDEINTVGKICAGIGMQSHFNDSGATVEKFDAALTAFAEAGFEIQITELDVTEFGEVTDKNKDTVYQKSAEFYGKLMSTLLRHKVTNQANITSVTIWGLYDNVSWRPSKSPLLFGTSVSDKKPAFDAVIDAVSSFETNAE